ncbi:MAG: EVE domain-containing protein [Candidatus Bathyarchaeota archaeon]|nr:EVE domain-containing protein [Candidatus Bathyarchaeota archaeon]
MKEYKSPESNKNGKKKTTFKIKNGDIIVYYAKNDGVVVGLFKVISDAAPLRADKDGKEYRVHKIEPYVTFGKWTYLDFIKLLQRKEDSNLRSKLLPVLSRKYYSEDQCQKLDEKEYLEIANALSDHTLRVKHNGPTGWKANPDLLCGILDYYNSRATSFVSLLMASVFGLVTLSAIIQSLHSIFGASLTLFEQLILILAVLLYLLFALAGYYTLNSYAHYTGIADKVKQFGIDKPYYVDLKRIVNIESSRTKEENLAISDYISKRDTQRGNAVIKKIMKRSAVFPISYMVTISLLAIIAFNSYMQYALTVIVLIIIGASIGFLLNKEIKKKTQRIVNRLKHRLENLRLRSQCERKHRHAISLCNIKGKPTTLPS